MKENPSGQEPTQKYTDDQYPPSMPEAAAEHTASIGALYGSTFFPSSRSKLPFFLGKTPDGQDITADITSLCHLLIAGGPGTAVSACIHTLVLSLLRKATPQEVRLILLDSQGGKLGSCAGTPYLLYPAATNPQAAIGLLQWTADEVMRRLRTAARGGDMEKMPYILVVIDELAQLMGTVSWEAEELICRITRAGHAVGIHLVIATQHPTVNVITGFIKFYVPSRIAFRVASARESRIIMDTQGAEKLTGYRDMLCVFAGQHRSARIQGCLASQYDAASAVDFLRKTEAYETKGRPKGQPSEEV